MGWKIRDLLRGLGAGTADDEPEPPAQSVEYKGFSIRPAPQREGGQWRTAGVISKQAGEETREHHFIRAEVHASREDAAAFSVTKARQIIDELGDRVFEEGR